MEISKMSGVATACKVLTIAGGQGSPAWKMFRKGMVTATDASVYQEAGAIVEVEAEARLKGVALKTDLLKALGITTKHLFDNTLYQTIMRKRGIFPEVEVTEPMLFGQKYEAKMFEHLEDRWGIKLVPGEIVESTAHEGFMASLDGRSSADDFSSILEIKMPFVQSGDFSPVRIQFAYTRKLASYLDQMVSAFGGAPLIGCLSPAMDAVRERLEELYAIAKDEAPTWDLPALGDFTADGESLSLASALESLKHGTLKLRKLKDGLVRKGLLKGEKGEKSEGTNAIFESTFAALANAQAIASLMAALPMLREEISLVRAGIDSGLLLGDAPLGEINHEKLGVKTLTELMERWTDLLSQTKVADLATAKEAVRKGLGLKSFPASSELLITAMRDRFSQLSALCTPNARLKKRQLGQAIHLKPNYWAQVAFQMLVTGAEETWFCVGAVKDGEIDPQYCIVERIERPSQEYYDQLVPYLSFIYEEYYLKNSTPPMIEFDKKAEAAVVAKLKQSDLFEGDTAQFVAHYVELLAEKDQLAKKISDCEDKLKAWQEANGDGIFGEAITLATKVGSTTSWTKIGKDKRLLSLVPADVFAAIVQENTKETKTVTIKVMPPKAT